VSSALEREILGQLILRPSLFESCDHLGPSLFSSPDSRKAYEALTEIWEEMRPEEVDRGVLAQKAGLGAAFVASLVEGNFRPDPATFIWRVRQLRRKRISERILKLAQDEGQLLVKIGEIDSAKIQEILASARELEGLEGRGGFDPGATLMTGTTLQTLQLEAAWAVEKLVPARSITVLHSPGGLGKTWLALALGNAVSRGERFLGLPTKQRPVVYVDFENPLPLLVERTRKLDIRDVLFWHLSASPPPPRLDTSEYALYRRLPAGALVIFDTLRAAHSGDENSSQDMALVMGRLKELRELGFDIFLIHHTGKASERVYKGSTAISDLADHVLKLYRSRRGSLEEVQDEGEPDPDATFVLATGKTRFEQFHLFLSFNPDAGGFQLAEDPHLEGLEALAGYIAGPGQGKNQGEIIDWARETLGGGRRRNFVALLNRGEREGHWQTRRGFKGSKLYEPKS